MIKCLHCQHHRDHTVIITSSLVPIPVNFKNGGISNTTFLALPTQRNPSHSLKRAFLDDKEPIEEYWVEPQAKGKNERLGGVEARKD